MKNTEATNYCIHFILICSVVNWLSTLPWVIESQIFVLYHPFNFLTTVKMRRNTCCLIGHDYSYYWLFDSVFWLHSIFFILATQRAAGFLNFKNWLQSECDLKKKMDDLVCWCLSCSYLGQLAVLPKFTFVIWFVLKLLHVFHDVY